MSVLILFVSVALMSLGWLWMDVGQASVASMRSQTTLDMTVLSSLRMRVNSLEAVAKRWTEFGLLFGSASMEGSVQLPSNQWTFVEKKAAELKRALPSYDGRATAIVKVVAEANQTDRDELIIDNNLGSRLGLTAESLTAVDEQGIRKTISGGWLRRQWQEKNPPTETRHRRIVRLRVGSGAPWVFVRESAGEIVWDVEEADPIVKQFGNGGYPSSWSQALHNGRLDPHRYALYRARLKGSSE